jgi:hypothetical protein
MVRSFTGAGAFRLENERLCTKCIFFHKKNKNKKTSNKKISNKKISNKKKKAYENPGH